MGAREGDCGQEGNKGEVRVAAVCVGGGADRGLGSASEFSGVAGVAGGGLGGDGEGEVGRERGVVWCGVEVG